jgi:hypothetical protein
MRQLVTNCQYQASKARAHSNSQYASVYINHPPQTIKTMLLSLALTGTGGHTAGSKGVTALRVGHRFEGISVVGDQGWAVQLTDATVVEVEAGLAGTGIGLAYYY